MNDFKNILIRILIHAKTYLESLSNFFTQPSEFIESLCSKSKAKDCLSRTRDSYFRLTCCRTHDLISAHHLDEIVRRSNSSFPELSRQLSATSASQDQIYFFILLIAISEVYKSHTPPQISNADFSKLLPPSHHS